MSIIVATHTHGGPAHQITPACADTTPGSSRKGTSTSSSFILVLNIIGVENGEGLRVSPMMCLCRPDLRLIIAIGHFRIKSCTYFPPFFCLIHISSGQRFQEMKRGLKIEIKYIMLNTAENVPDFICWIIWCPTVS